MYFSNFNSFWLFLFHLKMLFLSITQIMDCWLKAEMTTPKEMIIASINERESTSILKNLSRKNARKTRRKSMTKNILNLNSHGLQMKMSLFHFASFLLKINKRKHETIPRFGNCQKIMDYCVAIKNTRSLFFSSQDFSIGLLCR